MQTKSNDHDRGSTRTPPLETKTYGTHVCFIRKIKFSVAIKT